MEPCWQLAKLGSVTACYGTKPVVGKSVTIFHKLKRKILEGNL
jgi:hypothetical protein